ncbi:MAG: arginase family protein [Cyanobacteria bacterium J06639_14]
MAEFSSDVLNLFFPQWQGAGRLALHTGAKLLYASLYKRIALTQIPVASTYALTTDQHILGYSQITSQLSHAVQIIEAQNPSKILTIGGDCGVEIAPVSFLNRQYSEELALLWLDAHGDLNTPKSSPSSHFHGMPLRTLLGEGDPGIVSQAFSTLLPEQVFLIGAREFDVPERAFMRQQHLSVVTAEAINRGRFKQLLTALATGNFKKLYIHLDLDVIEPKEFPYVTCPTPNGIQIEKLAMLLLHLRKHFSIVGFSILEFLATEPQRSAVSEALKLLDTVLPEII